MDASARIAFLALTDPKDRPIQFHEKGTNHRNRTSAVGPFDVASDMSIESESNIQSTTPVSPNATPSFIYYDAVGPETMTILEMLRIFAKAQGNNHFYPVFIGYRNMEKLLNVRSLGNLNRQFVSLLRSEQDSQKPIIGNPNVWEKLLGSDAQLQRIETALLMPNENNLQNKKKRTFPFGSVARLVIQNPKLMYPGFLLSVEIIDAFLSNHLFSSKNSH
jgi:hypothetical protein